MHNINGLARAGSAHRLVGMKQSIDSHLGSHTDVAGLLSTIVPLTDVQQPFRRTQVLEHVTELEKTKETYKL